MICTASELGGTCDTLLYTLRPKGDELQALRQLNDILKGRATGPRPESSFKPTHDDGTRKVYLDVNLETFLRTAPVEPE